MPGLSLDINANPRGATSAVKSLGDDLEKVVDALDDVGRRGERAGDKLDDALRQAERQAKRTDDAVDQVGSSGFHKASAASGEFKQEALQNFSEVTSSFDGSMSSVAELAQGTLGGIASSIPGIGLLGGVAAVGIGAVGAAFAANDEAARVSAQKAGEWADQMIESGGRVLDEQIILSNAQKILNERGQEYNDAVAIQAATGLDLTTIIRGLAGDTDAWTAAQDAGAAASAANQAAMAEQEQQVTSAAGAVYDFDNKVWASNAAIERHNGLLDTANANFTIYGGVVEQGKDKTVEYTNAVNGIPEVKTVQINAVDNITKVLDGLKNQRHYINVDVNYRGASGQTWD